MNTVIFLTKDNKHEMAESIKRLAARQHTKVNGALIVCHQSVVSAKEAQKIAQPLIEKFVTGAAVKSNSNLSMPHESQIAVMLARFVALAYAKYPGPWLIIDTPAQANVDGWAEEALKQHRINGGKVVSMAKQDGKTLLTYGPTTIQLSVKTMKMLHFATNESWRSRGRYLLMNAGLKVVEPEVWMFGELSADQSPPIESNPAPSGFVDVVDEDCPRFNFDGERLKRITPEEFEQLKEGVIKLNSPDPQVCDHQERTILSMKIEKATGKKPHHFTGIDKLREMVQQLDPAVTV